MDAIVGIQRTCGDANVCLASADDPEPSTTAYVTDVPTTVYIWGGAYDEVPNPAAYSFDFTFTTCGDGAIEGAEVCDDNNHDPGDGCSSACQLEFGFTCSTAMPTVCTAFPDLGTFGGGGTITHTSTTNVPSGGSEFYTVTFTEAVEVNGTVTATGAGDPDIFGYSPTRLIDFVALDGTEDTSMTGPMFFPAGRYAIEINAYDQSPALAGYSISLTVTSAPVPTSIGTFAPAAAIPNTVQTMSTAAGASRYYSITFSAPVLFSGTLSGFTTGDPDIFMHSSPGALSGTLQQAVGGETWTDVLLPATTYVFRVKAFAVDGPVDAFTATMSTTAAPEPSLTANSTGPSTTLGPVFGFCRAIECSRWRRR
jgi:cysteine-rich repeat protein